MSRKLERQMDIVNYLFSGKREIYANLSAMFFVSVKTIKQDISELSIFYPIVTYIGRNGGVEMSKGYIINGFIMKREYLQLILNGLFLLKTQSEFQTPFQLEMINTIINMIKIKR